MNPNMAQSLSWDHIREYTSRPGGPPSGRGAPFSPPDQLPRGPASRAPAREERMMTREPAYLPG